MAEGDMVSFRLPRELADALRVKASGNEETLSDVMRRAALRELGICPVCGRDWPGGR